MNHRSNGIIILGKRQKENGNKTLQGENYGFQVRFGISNLPQLHVAQGHWLCPSSLMKNTRFESDITKLIILLSMKQSKTIKTEQSRIHSTLKSIHSYNNITRQRFKTTQHPISAPSHQPQPTIRLSPTKYQEPHSIQLITKKLKVTLNKKEAK